MCHSELQEGDIHDKVAVNDAHYSMLVQIPNISNIHCNPIKEYGINLTCARSRRAFHVEINGLQIKIFCQTVTTPRDE